MVLAPGRRKLGHVVLRRLHPALVVADLLPVHPDVGGRLHALEVEEDLASRPAPGEVERAPVGAHRVVARGDPGRRRGKGLVDVAEHRVPEALHLPAARDLDLVPARDVEAGLEERGRRLSRHRGPVELPGAAQQVAPGRGLAVALEGRLDAVEGHQGGVGLHLPPLEDGRVLPVGDLLRGSGHGGEGQQGQEAGGRSAGSGSSWSPCEGPSGGRRRRRTRGSLARGPLARPRARPARILRARIRQGRIPVTLKSTRRPLGVRGGPSHEPWRRDQ